MKWIAALSLLIFAGHTIPEKRIERGVFVSAQELAVSCQIMKDEVGENYLFLGRQGVSRPPGKPTTDMAAIGRCTGYVEGVADEFRERKGDYHSFPEGRGELPVLIDAFLKRVAEHPEEADLAASTVLHEADKDVLGLCGDCGFGLLVSH